MIATHSRTTEGVVAFKDWAVSINALGEGKQVMIFRKGGIAELGGAFKIEHPCFFLFPSYVHQDQTGVKPEYHAYLETVLENRPQGDDIHVSYWATCEEAIQLQTLDMALKLDTCHIFSEESVRKRWEFHSERPLWLLLLRVYRLKEPLSLESAPSYSGCRSWIDLEGAIGTRTCDPVLDDTTYTEMSNDVIQRL